MKNTKNKKEQLHKRKLEHIKIVLEENVEPKENIFEKYRLPYNALPEIDLSEIDTSVEFMGKNLSFPFIISSMTGGPSKGAVINKNLAIAAEKMKVALGLGSMRVILRDPDAIKSFDVKKYCPSVPLFANMGLVQLNYGYGAEEINKIIDSIDADGIFLHVNPLQEAIQPEGDTNFKNLLPKLEQLIKIIKKPIIIKEVGTGIDFNSAKKMAEIGVKWIDVAGVGGTSWTAVEAYRRIDKNLGHIFDDIGIPTDVALKGNSQIKGLNLIAGGGIRNGADIAKSIMLGAKLATTAKPLLQPALKNSDACIQKLESFRQQFRVAMFACGAKNVKSLSKLELSVNTV